MSWQRLLSNPRRQRIPAGDLRIGDTVIWTGFRLKVQMLEGKGGRIYVRLVGEDSDAYSFSEKRRTELVEVER